MLKKSYKGFWLWMLIFLVTMFGSALLPIEDTAVITRITTNICVLNVVLLAFIIYKTECVYWYNGTEYKDAVEAGTERRKAFAWSHLKRFGIFAVVFLVYSLVSYFLKIPYGIDVAVATIGMCVTAICTIRIKL